MSSRVAKGRVCSGRWWTCRILSYGYRRASSSALFGPSRSRRRRLGFCFSFQEKRRTPPREGSCIIVVTRQVCSYLSLLALLLASSAAPTRGSAETMADATVIDLLNLHLVYSDSLLRVANASSPGSALALVDNALDEAAFGIGGILSTRSDSLSADARRLALCRLRAIAAERESRPNSDFALRTLVDPYLQWANEQPEPSPPCESRS